MSAFEQNFLFLDNPRGGVENLSDMKAAGFGGVFCNVRDYPPEQWEATILPRARSLGMFCGPWGRTVVPNTHTFDGAVLDLIVTTADRWGQPLIVNSEKELDGTGAIYTTKIAQAVGTRDGAISMEPWLFPTVDWKPVAHLPMLLQIFPVEAPSAKDPEGCFKHAHDLGCECVYFTFGTYGGQKPSDFKLQAPYSLFTGDAMGAVYPPWSPTSSGFPACKETPVTDPWYSKPYKKGAAVGPENLPRVLRPPGKSVMMGDDVMAFKRAISHAQRWLPWEPSQWDNRYREVFALGSGTGRVAVSGVRGFQRQEGLKQDGILNNEVYQRIRRARIPVGPREGAPILDAMSISLLKQAAYELGPEAKKDKVRAAITDFCLRAEQAEDLWHYTQQRPYTGLGVVPERTHYNDCSGYIALVYYWARSVTDVLVPDPTGYRYTGYGNTWDDLDGHPRVATGNYLVGDLAHYDGHVTVCRKPGDSSSAVWSSFGSEAGPEAVPLHYRGDFLKVVRPPLLPG